MSNTSSRPKDINTVNLENASMVFSYWIRTIGSAENMQCDFILEFVLKFFFIPQFYWDSTRVDDKLMLSKGNMMVSNVPSKMDQKHWGSVCSQNVLCQEVLSAAQWEITLREFEQYPDEHRRDNMAIMMGYIDGEHIAKFNKTKLMGCTRHEVALYISHGMYPRIWTSSDWTNLHEKWKYNAKKGDTL